MDTADIVLAQAASPVAFTPAVASSDAGAANFDSENLGLAMRFIVTFNSGDGIVQSLGEWSACKGLKVEFKNETVKRGGEYGYEAKLPVQVAYGPVTLERAMQRVASQKLHDWLTGLAQQWMNSDNASPPAGYLAITLMDVHQNMVASWLLQQAFPVSWSGPALDAKSSTVAIESLTLEHQGFLDRQPALAKAMVTGGGGPPVTFDYNPATISISHSVTTHPNAGKSKNTDNEGKTGSAGGGPSGGSPVIGDFNQMVAASGITTIAMRQVTFIGPDVQDRCERLHSWTVLATDRGGKGDPNTSELPTLTFQWGSSQTYSVTLNQLTINYTRFTSEGKPVRAVVDMTFNLKGQSGNLTPTNPTSGGLPGRRSHLLTGAETLAGLATQTYGSPGRWRQIAAVNGIQDPIRVPPGTRLYLPSAEEVGR